MAATPVEAQLKLVEWYRRQLNQLGIRVKLTGTSEGDLIESMTHHRCYLCSTLDTFVAMTAITS